ncbi:MAG: hypothetical protein ACYC7E_20585 [Armatimonadota bacterium]
MGPTVLFDKSFLQSLSVNESLWFDHFFITNVCPLFYLETIADLHKIIKRGHSPESEVIQIANKIPEMNGAPNVYHEELCIGSLLGQSIPMTGQIVLAQGKYVRSDSKTGVVFDLPPEAKAFERWRDGDFKFAERAFAGFWREALRRSSHHQIVSLLKDNSRIINKAKSVNEAKNIADEIVRDADNTKRLLQLLTLKFNIAVHYQEMIMKRLQDNITLSLPEFAPYAAFIMTIEVFFYIALASSLISGERPSNHIDISYMFYLPFSMIFVSSDKLHRLCAPLFLRTDQQFVWGPELKEDLLKVNNHYNTLSKEIKEQGIFVFADSPPEDNFLITSLWDHHLSDWRRNKGKKLPEEISTHMLGEIERLTKARSLSGDEINFNSDTSDLLSISRRMRKYKGDWYQLPKDFSQE